MTTEDILCHTKALYFILVIWFPKVKLLKTVELLNTHVSWFKTPKVQADNKFKQYEIEKMNIAHVYSKFNNLWHYLTTLQTSCEALTTCNI